jgi:hypothetical protein
MIFFISLFLCFCVIHFFEFRTIKKCSEYLELGYETSFMPRCSCGMKRFWYDGVRPKHNTRSNKQKTFMWPLQVCLGLSSFGTY